MDWSLIKLEEVLIRTSKCIQSNSNFFIVFFLIILIRVIKGFSIDRVSTFGFSLVGLKEKVD